MKGWAIYIHPDGRYASIRRTGSQRGDTLLRLPEGARDREVAVAFLRDAGARGEVVEALASSARLIGTRHPLARDSRK